MRAMLRDENSRQSLSPFQQQSRSMQEESNLLQQPMMQTEPFFEQFSQQLRDLAAQCKKIDGSVSDDLKAKVLDLNRQFDFQSEKLRQ